MVESLVAIAGVAMVIGAILFHMIRGNQAWKRAAERLGLEHDRGSAIQDLCLKGQIRGRAVKVRQHVARRGVSNRHYVEVEIALENERWSSVILRPRSPRAGGEGQDTGDPRFDDAFEVTGRVDDAFKRGLGEGGGRRTLYQIRSGAKEFKIMSGQLIYEKQGVMKEAEAVEALVRRGVGWAEKLDEAMAVPATTLETMEMSDG